MCELPSMLEPQLSHWFGGSDSGVVTPKIRCIYDSVDISKLQCRVHFDQLHSIPAIQGTEMQLLDWEPEYPVLGFRPVFPSVAVMLTEWNSDDLAALMTLLLHAQLGRTVWYKAHMSSQVRHYMDLGCFCDNHWCQTKTTTESRVGKCGNLEALSYFWLVMGESA